MAANPVEAFLFSICAVPIYLLVGSMIGACFLQVSVGLHNKLADNTAQHRLNTGPKPVLSRSCSTR